LMDATLPVVMRRTCVCPSRLLSAAVNCPVMGTGKVVVSVTYSSVTSARTNQHERTGHDLKLDPQFPAIPKASNYCNLYLLKRDLTLFYTISCVCQNEIKFARIRKTAVIDGNEWVCYNIIVIIFAPKPETQLTSLDPRAPSRVHSPTAPSLALHCSSTFRFSAVFQYLT
jgi:hypothetical protein